MNYYLYKNMETNLPNKISTSINKYNKLHIVLPKAIKNSYKNKNNYNFSLCLPVHYAI